MTKFKTYGRITLTFGAAETEKTSMISGLFGEWTTLMAVVTIPNWTNNVTLTYAHVLETTAPVYSIAGLARNQPITAPAVLLYERPIYNNCVIKATLSGVPGAGGGDVLIDLYLEG